MEYKLNINEGTLKKDFNDLHSIINSQGPRIFNISHEIYQDIHEVKVYSPLIALFFYYHNSIRENKTEVHTRYHNMAMRYLEGFKEGKQFVFVDTETWSTLPKMKECRNKGIYTLTDEQVFTISMYSGYTHKLEILSKEILYMSLDYKSKVLKV